MNKSESYDAVVALRTSGERTFEASRAMIREQVPGLPLYVIDEKPFKKAFERCLEAGLEAGARWLITADADMLLLPDAINRMLQEAEKMPAGHLQLQGRIYDKITGTFRKGGPRIYRTEHLGKLLALSKESSDHIRPESSKIRILQKQGHPSRYLYRVFALHDFEQYYKDLYRKALVHAVKHPELVTALIYRSTNLQERDDDFRVVLKAVWDGLTSHKEISIDSRLFEEESNRTLAELGLQEKSELELNGVTSEFVDLLSIQLPEEFEQEKEHPKRYDLPLVEEAASDKFRTIVRKKGIIRGISHSIGSMLIKTGEKLRGRE